MSMGIGFNPEWLDDDDVVSPHEDRLLKQETALKLQRERLDWERAEREREAKIRQKELEIFK